MKALILFLSGSLLASCSLFGLGGKYIYPCEKILKGLKNDSRLLVVEGEGPVISTSAWDVDLRTDSVGEGAAYQRGKADMLQKLYYNHSKLDIKKIEKITHRKKGTFVESTSDEDVKISSRKMVILSCKGSVYGIVKKGDFQ
ncbi:MAG: hypothetical protein CME71_00310 [Halobacteriovorax sp.]|nr:hypothetical protein [Halobacteriovorax sp.]|tara:strand:- start:1975 stop:2400 length:426 start_codon:yes stop_codon:yes gene_type:complete